MTLPAWFEKTRWGQQLVAERVKERQRTRGELSQEISAARAQVAKEAPGLSARVQKTREYLEEARTAVKEAEVAAQQAMAALSSLSNQTERTITRCECDLRESADPAIGAFLAELVEIRHRSCAYEFAREGEASVRARQAKLMELRASAEALQLEVDADISARLTELRTAAALAMLPAPEAPARKAPNPETSQNYWERRQQAALERQRRPATSPWHEPETESR